MMMADYSAESSRSAPYMAGEKREYGNLNYGTFDLHNVPYTLSSIFLFTTGQHVSPARSLSVATGLRVSVQPVSSNG